MKSATRSYSSPVREERAERTRRGILDAALGVLADEEGELSLAAVAKAAGVAQRTVFRHFATKEDLLDAVWARFNAELGIGSFPRSEEELLERLPGNFDLLDRHERLVRGYLFSKQGRELRARANPRRRDEIRECLAGATAGMAPAEAERVSALVGLLISVPAWNLLRERNNWTGRQAAGAVGWAVRTLLDAARRRPSDPPRGRGSGRG